MTISALNNMYKAQKNKAAEMKSKLQSANDEIMGTKEKLEQCNNEILHMKAKLEEKDMEKKQLESQNKNCITQIHDLKDQLSTKDLTIENLRMQLQEQETMCKCECITTEQCYLVYPYTDYREV